ncbi:MAG: tRNA dihydrouridine synthase DusB [Deltaproteobacteria bacterium RBG_16_48_10]|nr:MAG: tRNA dihydrouridine synthase DusB [Deltaproteobacteria bacterium RBG_16_48_10]
MKIGNLHLDHPLFLAPLSGITDYPFRKLAREFGCGLAFTEMVSAEGLLRKGGAFLKMGEGEHPVSIQLSGSNPDALARAAEMAEEAGADAIDINMGCPSRKVTDTGAGADLMRFPSKVEFILRETKKRIRCPLTIKIRSGWDAEHVNAIEISKIAENCGVDEVTIHPRTRAQWFHGQADWKLIGEVKRSVRIPVIGNGDVTTPHRVKKMLEETGCDGVMIGKGALGNPWIFDPQNRWASEEGMDIRPSLEEKRRVIERHLLLLQDYYGNHGAVKEIRRHIVWYTKGLPESASFRFTVFKIGEKEALLESIHSYFDSVKRRG